MVGINEDFELDEFLKTKEVLLFLGLNGNEAISRGGGGMLTRKRVYQWQTDLA